jgi:hypothetical protein
MIQYKTLIINLANYYLNPRVAAIRIDVHHAAENPTNMTRTLSTPVHVRLTYASYGGPRTWQPFVSCQ